MLTRVSHQIKMATKAAKATTEIIFLFKEIANSDGIFVRNRKGLFIEKIPLSRSPTIFDILLIQWEIVFLFFISVERFR